MKNLFSKFGWCIALSILTLLTGCAPDIEEGTEDYTLEVTPKEVTFAKEASTQEVTIKTNAPQWSYMVTPQADWLNIQTKGEKMSLAVADNTNHTARTAKITILAGGTKEEVVVKQMNADLVLNIDNTDLIIDAFASRKVVAVVSNDKQWTIDAPADASWLKVTASPHSGILIFDAERNPLATERETTLTFRMSNGEMRKVVVKQAAQLRYFLPYQEEKKVMNYKDLIHFENRRGFVLTQFDLSADTWLGRTPDVLAFRTASDVISTLTYRRPYNHFLVYETATMRINNIKEMEEGGGLREYLKQQGYRKISGKTLENLRLESPDRFFWVSVKPIAGTDAADVRFTPQILQEESYPTFEHFPPGPEGFLDLLNKVDKKFDYVDNWEKNTLGSTLHFEMKNQWKRGAENEHYHAIYKEKKAGKYDAAFHFYTFYLRGAGPQAPAEYFESVQHARLCFDNINLVIFTIGEKQFKTTVEFNNLAFKNGFEYKSIDSGGVHFYRAEDQLTMTVTMYIDKNLFGVERMACIDFYNDLAGETRSNAKAGAAPTKADTAPAAATATQLPTTFKRAF